MNNRILTGLTLIVIAGIGVLFLINYSMPLGVELNTGYLSPNSVRGSATEKNGKLWTLNFEQQTKLLSLVNHSTRYEREVSAGDSFTFDSVIIYRFDQPNIALSPIGTNNEFLIFSFSDKILKESSPGMIQKLLAETYDP